MYRPRSTDAEYFNNMVDQIDQMHTEFDKVILMGDLSFDYVLDKSLTRNPLHHIKTLYDMKQLVNLPTRVTSTTSALHHVIMSNDPESHVLTDVYDIGLNVHNMIYPMFAMKM